MEQLTDFVLQGINDFNQFAHLQNSMRYTQS